MILKSFGEYGTILLEALLNNYDCLLLIRSITSNDSLIALFSLKNTLYWSNLYMKGDTPNPQRTRRNLLNKL